MTPPASTAAGRASTDGGHRRALPREPIPRRVSGPTRGRAPARPAARAAQATLPAPTRPAKRPATRPRRVSGPATRTRRAGQRTAPRLTARAFAFVRGLPDHPLLDRIVRGRAWIPLLGVMLAGIVAMQVEMLKLGAGTGRAIDQSTALQSRNELLRASVASLADDQRIERLAAQMGMVMPAPTEIHFLSARPGSAARAASNIQAPDPTTFLSTLESETAASEAQNQATEPSTSTTTSGTTTPATTTPETPATADTPTTTPTAPTGAGAVSPTPVAPVVTPGGTPEGTTAGTPQGTTAGTTAGTTGGAAATTGG